MRIIGLALVALFAMSAIAAATATAAPKHIYMVEGKELKAGETKEITAKDSEEFTLKGKGALEIEAVTKCKKLKLKASEHPEIIGGTPGTSAKEVIEFEECSGTVGGSKCSSVEIENAATNNELVTVVKPESLKGKLATLFTPTKPPVFSKEKLNKCGIFGSQSATVEGTSAALVEPEATEALEGMLVWSEKSEITEIEKQNGTKATVGLTSGKKKATLNGIALVALVSGQKWGAF
ncbi:MAG: hypothetical protein ABSH36_05805 [Solirubrobacteraceae bacterium]